MTLTCPEETLTEKMSGENIYVSVFQAPVVRHQNIVTTS